MNTSNLQSEVSVGFDHINDNPLLNKSLDVRKRQTFLQMFNDHILFEIRVSSVKVDNKMRSMITLRRLNEVVG
jgi:hypothetical protein